MGTCSTREKRSSRESAGRSPYLKAKFSRKITSGSKLPRYCVELFVFGLLKRKEVFHLDGGPLLNGAFGVSKGKTVRGGKGKRDVLMLIINLIPMNSFMNVQEGDIRTLPCGGQPSGIMLLGEDLVWAFSDRALTGAFRFFQKK